MYWAVLYEVRCIDLESEVVDERPIRISDVEGEIAGSAGNFGERGVGLSGDRGESEKIELQQNRVGTQQATGGQELTP